MNKLQRRNGRLIRKIARLDRTWRLGGMQEGRTENQLAFELGRAARRGMHRKSRAVQIANARSMGQRSGWEQYR